MPDAPPDLLTPAEVARRLGICTRTLRKHVDGGAIAYVVVGRGTQRVRRMFTPADVEAFCDRRRRREIQPEPTKRVQWPQKTRAPVYDFTSPPPSKQAPDRNRPVRPAR